MSVLKFLLLVPLMFFSNTGASQEMNHITKVHLKYAEVISVEHSGPGSGIFHILAVITVSTPEKSDIKLYATYFGEEQLFPSAGEICSVDAEKTYRNADIAQDGINPKNKLLIYPIKMECGDQIYVY